MLTPKSTADELLTALHWYFGQRTDGFSQNVHTLLGKCRCDLKVEIEALLGFDTDFNFHIQLLVPPANIDFACMEGFQDEIKTALNFLVDLPEGNLYPNLTIKVLGPQEPLTVGVNNCYFKREWTYLHDELHFRSKAEIAIYDELKQRDVLFFPNPAAVLGASASEYGAAVEKKEPDFLICYKGKWGILEINHDDFHTGIVRTTKDHERARKFNHYGLFFIHAYDYDKCRADRVGVVDEFLKLLANHR